MRDFLGREINVGDYVAFPGRGNVASEYGLLLLKITKIENGKIYGLRFDTIYKQPGTQSLNILKKTNIGNHNKCVKVTPPVFITDAFDRLFNSKNMSELYDIEPSLGSWTHGNERFSW